MSYFKPIKSFFIIILLILTIDSAYSQIYLGLKSGARMNWLKYEEFNSEDYSRAPFYGFSAGFSSAFKVQKRFLLQFDVLYAQNGKNIMGIEDPVLENNARYHYINTPIVYKLDFIEAIGKRTFKWHVGVGPNVDFWLGGNGKLKSVELLEENIDEIEYKVRFGDFPADPEDGTLYFRDANRVQLGLIVSTGLIFEPAPGQVFQLDFMYLWGHSNIAKEEGRYSNVIGYRDNLDASFQSFQVTISYLYDFINKGKKEKKNYYENK